MDFELSTINYELSAMSYALWAMSYELSAISYELLSAPCSTHYASVTGHWIPVTGFRVGSWTLKVGRSMLDVHSRCPHSVFPFPFPLFTMRHALCLLFLFKLYGKNRLPKKCSLSELRYKRCVICIEAAFWQPFLFYSAGLASGHLFVHINTFPGFLFSYLE